jgi:hypothetical protein
VRGRAGKLSGDQGRNAFKISEHLVVPEAQHPKRLRIIRRCKDPNSGLLR